MKKTNILKNLIWIIKKIFQYDTKYLFLCIINSFFNGIIPVLSLVVMQRIVNTLQTALENMSIVLYLVVIYVSIEIINTIFTNFFGYYNAKVSATFSLHFSQEILCKVAKLKLVDYEDSKTYDIINRAKNEGGDKLLAYFINSLAVCTYAITTLLYLLILFEFNSLIAVIVLIVPLIRFFINKYFNLKRFNILRERTNESRKVWYIEFLLTYGNAFKELKLYNLFSHFIEKYKKIRKTFNVQDLKIVKKSSICFSILNTVESLIDGVLFAYVIFLGYTKKILIGDAITYTRTIMQSKSAITNIFTNVSNLYSESLYIDQVFELLNLTEDTNIDKEKLKYVESIKVINLCYKYKGSTDYVLDNINFEINRGKKLAIMGRNGSGKTTLIKILMGLYDDYEGDILINGVELRNLDKENYMSHISALFQDFVKYESTYRENLSYGNLNLLNNDKELYRITRKFQLNNIIMNHEKQLDMQLGNWFDNGINLSTGQWQKVAIARAFTRASDIYILDEPDAALDIISEEKMLNLYTEMFENSISLVISHKLNKLILLVDEIILLEKGRIVERGSHKELSTCNGLYSEFLKIRKELE